MTNPGSNRALAWMLTAMTVLVLGGVLAGPASAAEGDETVTFTAPTADRAGLSCTAAHREPVVVNLDGTRYLQLQARMWCNQAGNLGIRLFGCRQYQACVLRADHEAYRPAGYFVQVVQRTACANASVNNFASVAYFSFDGDGLGSIRAPRADWVARSCG